MTDEPAEVSKVYGGTRNLPDERLGEQGQPVGKEREAQCRECGVGLGAGYLCDDCDTIEVIE